MVEVNSIVIDGVSDSDLRAVTSTLVSAPSANVEPADRFFEQVLNVAEVRAQSSWAGEADAPLALFVMARYPRKALKSLGLDSVPVVDLGGTAEPLLGRLFLLNGDASQGYALPLPTTNPGELFEWLQTQEISDLPVIALYRETKKLIERATGAAGETTKERTLRDAPPELTAEELARALEAFHLEETLTPVVMPEVWATGKAGVYYPCENPEKVIQRQLRTFLNGWFKRQSHAEDEDKTPIGRIDIRLLRATEHGLAYWAVIELKVTKTYRHPTTEKRPNKVSTADNVEGIAEGIRQARSFGKIRQCSAFLEVYDLRRAKRDNLFEHKSVRDELANDDDKPIMTNRPMFGSSSMARKAGYPA